MKKETALLFKNVKDAKFAVQNGCTRVAWVFA